MPSLSTVISTSEGKEEPVRRRVPMSAKIRARGVVAGRSVLRRVSVLAEDRAGTSSSAASKSSSSESDSRRSYTEGRKFAHRRCVRPEGTWGASLCHKDVLFYTSAP